MRKEFLAILFAVSLILTPALGASTVAGSVTVTDGVQTQPRTWATTTTGVEPTGTAPTTTDGRADTEQAPAGETRRAAGVTGVGADLADAEGTVMAVVRLEAVSVPSTASEEEAASTMKTKAMQSQKPLLSFASSHDGITVLNRFWIANAVLVRIDTDVVDPDEIVGVENVRAVHENFKVELPEVPSTNNSTNATSYRAASAGDGTFRPVDHRPTG